MALCTAEALAIALDVCDGHQPTGPRTEAVRKVLSAWSEQQLGFMKKSSSIRHRTDKKDYVPGFYDK
jgi:hypothetical protein